MISYVIFLVYKIAWYWYFCIFRHSIKIWHLWGIQKGWTQLPRNIFFTSRIALDNFLFKFRCSSEGNVFHVYIDISWIIASSSTLGFLPRFLRIASIISLRKIPNAKCPFKISTNRCLQRNLSINSLVLFTIVNSSFLTMPQHCLWIWLLSKINATPLFNNETGRTVITSNRILPLREC